MCLNTSLRVVVVRLLFAGVALPTPWLFIRFAWAGVVFPMLRSPHRVQVLVGGEAGRLPGLGRSPARPGNRSCRARLRLKRLSEQRLDHISSAGCRVDHGLAVHGRWDPRCIFKQS